MLALTFLRETPKVPKSYDLPSLGDLACFEATARHLSFKDAASELNVTPAAVSHRIKALEEDLGQALFTRKYRGVELTEPGALLFVALQRGFETISDCVKRLRTRLDFDGVTIAATSAVSGLWLTEHLAQFWALHPDFEISQLVQDSEGPTAPDLSIFYGSADDVVDETHLLFESKILALGTLEFAEKYKISDLSDLRRSPLVHVHTPENDWTDWNAWFASFGVKKGEGSNYWLNNYLIALRAAENNVGAVLGWEALLQPQLVSERLVPLVPDAMEAPHAFYLRVHSGASKNAHYFADWLIATAQNSLAA